jgi:hypothetical protein
VVKIGSMDIFIGHSYNNNRHVHSYIMMPITRTTCRIHAGTVHVLLAIRHNRLCSKSKAATTRDLTLLLLLLLSSDWSPASLVIRGGLRGVTLHSYDYSVSQEPVVAIRLDRRLCDVDA